MTETASHDPDFPRMPDTSHLITENDDPVDNIPSEKNQRLLVGSLYASWSGPPPVELDGEILSEEPRSFVATANVGLFDRPVNDPLVPDVLVSNDIELGDHDWGPTGTRSYFVWQHGKPPELVIEIVSNRKGGELARKRLRYAQMRIAHYVVFDPGHHLGDQTLRAFKLVGDRLEPVIVPAGTRVDVDSLGLQLGVWEGVFEQQDGLWLRFYDPAAQLLLTGDEKADAERQKADAERQKADAERQKAGAERQKADAERQRADAERQRAEALAAKLRALGIDPDA
ncbi:MAG: Uma2 family endonuclease [Myxococcota bacterium]